MTKLFIFLILFLNSIDLGLCVMDQIIIKTIVAIALNMNDESNSQCINKGGISTNLLVKDK